MYLANKVQNIQGSADTLLDLAGIEQDEIRPVAEAMEQGGRLAAKAKVTDAILDKCKPIAGHAGRLHRGDRGVPRRRLHARHARALGRDRHEQIRLFGERVLPQFRADRSTVLAEARSRIRRYTRRRPRPTESSCSWIPAPPTSASATASFPALCTSPVCA